LPTRDWKQPAILNSNKGSLINMKDLFGNEVSFLSHVEEDLANWNENTFSQRVERLRYLDRIYPPGYGMMSVAMYYLFDEAKFTFVNGQFVATILLTQSMIEQWLDGVLKEKGIKTKKPNPGLKEILEKVESHKLLHPFIIEKVDRLRQIRNPFVHYRPMDDPDNLDLRSFNQNTNMNALLEKDAKEALALMYEIIQQRF
jgi:hypothetical protein